MQQQLRRPRALTATNGSRPARRAGSQSARRQSKARKEALTAYLFILPALLFYVVFLALPTVGTVFISFFDWTGTTLSELDWNGVGNYTELAGDEVFRKALVHNIVFIVVGATLAVAIGLVLAVLLEQGLPGSGLFRGAFFIPTILSLIVVGLVFSLMASPELGLVNPFLEAIGLGGLKRAWLGDPQTALASVIAGTVWRDFGFAMLIFVAALKGFDTQLFEAARLDGASPLQIFRRITVPLLRPVTITVLVLITIGMLKLFDLVYVMTDGGPDHSSEVLSTWMYAQAFNFDRLGYGSAIAVFLLLLTVVVGVVQLRAGRDNT